MTMRTKSLFAAGVVLRLFAFPLKASAVVQEYFIPFLDMGVANWETNPWTLFPPRFFPYGSVLYGLMVSPRLLAKALVGEQVLLNQYVSMALFKLPLLVLDVSLLWLLMCIAPKRRLQVVVYYWLNPILLFVTYWHGQLDIAATCFCVASLVAAIRDKAVLSGLLMAMATLCKTHVAIAVPIFVAYLWNREFLPRGVIRVSQWFGTWLLFTAVGFWPHLRAGTLGYVTATSPQAFQLFEAHINLDHGQVVFLGIGLIAVLIGRLSLAQRMSELGLVFGVGITFGVLVLITNSSAGWYFWPMPFLVLLYANYSQVSVPLYIVYCALYIGYFGVIVDTDSEFLKSTVFTLLQTTLAVFLYTVWRLVVRIEAPFAPKNRPVLFGIAGDSGSGKNVLSEVIADLFDQKSSTLLEGDDYHKWERGNPKWADYTHLDPKANNLDELAAHTSDLLQGRLVWQPHYDHARGQFTAPREIRSSKVVIVQGLHTLYLREMRKQFDVKVFLAPHPSIRRAWKIRRDVAERGHELEKVTKNLMSRRDDAERHIEPQRDKADWIIEAVPNGVSLSDADILAGKPLSFRTRHVIWNDVPVSQLCTLLQQTDGCDTTLKVVPGDMDRLEMTVHGRLTKSQVEACAYQLFPALRNITNCSRPPVWRPDDHGVKQLIALAFLSRKLYAANY